MDDIRAEIESQGSWDYAGGSSAASTAAQDAAARYGFFPPFTDEEKALIKVLRRKDAGKMICTYAWGLYALSEDAPQAPQLQSA